MARGVRESGACVPTYPHDRRMPSWDGVRRHRRSWTAAGVQRGALVLTTYGDDRRDDDSPQRGRRHRVTCSRTTHRRALPRSGAARAARRRCRRSGGTRVMGRCARPTRKRSARRELDVLKCRQERATRATPPRYHLRGTVKTHLLHIYAKPGSTIAPPRPWPRVQPRLLIPAQRRADPIPDRDIGSVAGVWSPASRLGTAGQRLGGPVDFDVRGRRQARWLLTRSGRARADDGEAWASLDAAPPTVVVVLKPAHVRDVEPVRAPLRGRPVRAMAVSSRLRAALRVGRGSAARR